MLMYIHTSGVPSPRLKPVAKSATLSQVSNADKFKFGGHLNSLFNAALTKRCKTVALAARQDPSRRFKETLSSQWKKFSKTDVCQMLMTYARRLTDKGPKHTEQRCQTTVWWTSEQSTAGALMAEHQRFSADSSAVCRAIVPVCQHLPGSLALRCSWKVAMQCQIVASSDLQSR